MELLVKLESADDSSNLKAWSRGHVVAVKPDGWKWGKLECPPKFCVITVTDLIEKDAEKYMQNDVDITDPKKPVVIAIRKVKIDLDGTAITKKISDSIKNTGKVTVLKSEIDSFTKATVEAIGK